MISDCLYSVVLLVAAVFALLAFLLLRSFNVSFVCCYCCVLALFLCLLLRCCCVYFNMCFAFVILFVVVVACLLWL